MGLVARDAKFQASMVDPLPWVLIACWYANSLLEEEVLYDCWVIDSG